MVYDYLKEYSIEYRIYLLRYEIRLSAYCLYDTNTVTIAQRICNKYFDDFTLKFRRTSSSRVLSIDIHTYNDDGNKITTSYDLMISY